MVSNLGGDMDGLLGEGMVLSIDFSVILSFLGLLVVSGNNLLRVEFSDSVKSCSGVILDDCFGDGIWELDFAAIMGEFRAFGSLSTFSVQNLGRLGTH